MRVIHPLKMDLVGPWCGNLLHMVQGDSNTRVVELQLFSNEEEWEPSVVEFVTVAFKKPDQTKGFYETDCDIHGNRVQVVLAPQVLTACGKVTVVVELHDAEGDSLASFPFGIMVDQNPGVNAVASEDYFDYVHPLITEAVKEANLATAEAYAAAEKANSASEVAYRAERKVDALREVVSKFHNNIVETAKGEVIQLSDATDMELAGLRICGKTIQNGAPTPEVPVPLDNVGESGSVTVNVIGKNLLDQSSSNWQADDDNNGITYSFVRDSNGNLLYIVANGTTPDNAGSHSKKAFTLLPAGTYVISSSIDGSDSGTGLRIGKGPSATYVGLETGNGYTVTLTEETYIAINPTIGAGQTVSNVKFYPMIRMASVKNDVYEPYVRKDITALTPGGLPGIPVSSGGNYTDANGQQWICDEVDFEKGVYVQRVYRQTYTGSSNEAWGKSNATAKDRFYTRYMVSNTMKPCLCNMAVFIPAPAYENGKCFVTFNSSNNVYYFEIIAGDYGTFGDAPAWRRYLGENPMEVLYVLDEEKETPLSEIDPDALAQYATLHTNYPNTTLYNDAGAGMEVKYVADTQKYVDKKFEALEAAIANLI